MRITQCKEVSGKTPGYTYSYKAKKEKKAIQGSFRLLLFQDLTGTGSVFYIKVPNSVNHYIWNKCLDVRDSGPCSIGSIFVFMGPKPITDVYCNDIYILTPSGGAILIEEPKTSTISDFWSDASDSNKTVSFQQTGKIFLVNLAVTTCNCVGFFCDRQNLTENQKNGNSCPCYSSGDARHAKLTLNFTLKIELRNGITLQVDDFTSHRFSQFFLKSPFQSTTSFNEWDHTDKYIKLVQSVTALLNFVNVNGQWTVIGWSKRGEINDQSVLGEDQKVQSTDVKHHITTIFPLKLYSENEANTFPATLKQYEYDNTV